MVASGPGSPATRGRPGGPRLSHGEVGEGEPVGDDERVPAEVLAVDAPAELARLGLDQHLSSQRSNGLRAMVARIRSVVATAITCSSPRESAAEGADGAHGVGHA